MNDPNPRPEPPIARDFDATAAAPRLPAGRKSARDMARLQLARDLAVLIQRRLRRRARLLSPTEPPEDILTSSAMSDQTT